MTTTDGPRADRDFAHAGSGEIAVPTGVCGQRRCGCDRAFGGVDSHATSTLLVVGDVDIDEAVLVERIAQSLRTGGWGRLLPPTADNCDPIREWAQQKVGITMDLAERFEEGTHVRVQFQRACAEWTVEPRIDCIPVGVQAHAAEHYPHDGGQKDD